MPQRPHRHLSIPVELVTFRDTEFEGGGNVYPREDFAAHGQQLLRNVAGVKRVVRASPDPLRDRKVFFEVRAAEGVKLKDKYQLLKTQFGIDVVNTPSPDIGLAVSDRASFDAFEDRISRYAHTHKHEGKSYLSFIERVSVVAPETKLSDGLRHVVDERNGSVAVLIHLFRTLSREDGRLVADAIVGVAHRDQGRAEEMFSTASGRLVIPATLSAKAIRYLAENYASVMQLEEDSYVLIPVLAGAQPITPGTRIGPPIGDVTVGVVDSGVDSTHPYISPLLNGVTSHVPVGHRCDSIHGTFVASRVVYGDSILDQVGRGTLEPMARVRDIRVFAIDPLGNPWGPRKSEFSKLMQEIVENNRDLKIFNLSFVFPQDSVADDKVSFVGSELDALARKHDLLFVVAAGNYPLKERNEQRPAAPYPQYFTHDTTRLCGPADLFLGVSVGAVARAYNGGSLAQQDEPSPFSRRGPGMGGSRKPDLVEHGGNLTQTWAQQDVLGVSGLQAGSQAIAFGVGTSYAAPVVASHAARILHAYPTSSAAMLRTMLVHCAEMPRSPRFDVHELIRHVGHGIPKVEKALESVGSRVTYLFQGTLPQQTYQSVRFRVPTLAEAPRRGPKLKVRVTLSYDAPVDPDKGSEYAGAHVWVKLRKIDAQGSLVDVQPDSRENSPQDYREKFFPLVNFAKEFTKGFRGGDWEVQLRLSTRWDIPPNFSQAFALVVSVEDPGGTLDLFSAIQQEVPNTYLEVSRTRVQ